MKKTILVAVLVLSIALHAHSQACTPAGDEVSYGTGDVWTGYVYDNLNLTNYKGYVTEGTSGNPNFDENFGGDNVTYNTNGCSLNTSTFSVRYKLRKTFTNGIYEFIVGGDDGYRLSLDGGATWVINQWVDQSYAISYYSTTLNGTYDIVLEYYENGGGNRISFTLQSGCGSSGNPAVYGTGNTWIGYVYDGTSMNFYRGFVTEGSGICPNFDQSFGGTNTNYNTSDCSVQTETFSVRYRLQKNFSAGTYIITVGGDDGYRLSLDGGATWVINRWFDQSYNVSSTTQVLNGTYNMVLEFYENSGGNRISIDITNSTLAVKLGSVQLQLENDKPRIEWTTLQESSSSGFSIEKSDNGNDFREIGFLPTKAVGGESNQALNYQFTDKSGSKYRCFYRIAMVDLKGTKTYSKVLVYEPRQKASITIFPTMITNNRFKLRSNLAAEQLNLQVVDFSGRKYYETNISTTGNSQTQDISIPGIRLKPGMYRVIIQKDNKPILQQTVVAE